MTSFTLSLPDETYHRLAEIARIRGISIGEFFDGVATALVTEADAEARFRARAQRGLGKAIRGLELLRKVTDTDDTRTPTRPRG
jgi:predicted transcriptional regulator